MNSKSKIEKILVTLLLILSFVPRFASLGYSTYYGDETKVLYTDKTIPALTFLMDQRKGPVQFVVAWVMEKLTGGYQEFWMRLPFAIAGFLTVIVFYIVVRKLFNWQAALIATLLFASNGFNIAFARTVQYQSFLLLFGFLAILCGQLYLAHQGKFWLFLAALAFCASFYSHYDAVLFLLPLAFFLGTAYRQKNLSAKTGLLYFVLPIVLILGAFYIPYTLKGFFYANTINYLARRVTGSNFNTNSSFLTFFIYNPFVPTFYFLLFSIFAFFRRKFVYEALMLTAWYVSALVLYEVIFSNPGTHIHNIFVPLYILTGVGVYNFFCLLSGKVLKGAFASFVALILLSQLALTTYIFMPTLNHDYPWRASQILGYTLPTPNKYYQLFLYGFPYDRGWREVQQYLYSQRGVRGVYTNDNSTIAQYYLMKFVYTAPGPNFLPQYYIFVNDNQEFGLKDLLITPEQLQRYVLDKEFFVEGNGASIDAYVATAQVYRLVDPIVVTYETP